MEINTELFYSNLYYERYQLYFLEMLPTIFKTGNTMDTETEASLKISLKSDLCICISYPYSCRNNEAPNSMQTDRRITQKKIAQHRPFLLLHHEILWFFVLFYFLPCPQSQLCKGFQLHCPIKHMLHCVDLMHSNLGFQLPSKIKRILFYKKKIMTNLTISKNACYFSENSELVTLKKNLLINYNTNHFF